MKKFLTFLEALHEKGDEQLIETIAKGFLTINENALYNDNTGKWHSEYQAKLKARKEDGSYVYDDASLKYIIKDCNDALDAFPENPKAGQYADEIHYCATELRRRQGK